MRRYVQEWPRADWHEGAEPATELDLVASQPDPAGSPVSTDTSASTGLVNREAGSRLPTGHSG
jgi:hypothetical protein